MAQVALSWIPEGDVGTYATLLTMRRLARAGAARRRLQQLAVRLRMEARGDRCRYILALRNWLARNVRFRLDPPDVETIRAPLYMLDTYSDRGYAWGDCDEVATLAAALGLAVRLRARFVVYAFALPWAPYSHVFTELECGGVWYELDTTAPAQFGPWDAPSRRQTLTV